MIPEIIQTLSDKIEQSNIVEKAFGLAALYNVNGNKEPVTFENEEPLHINFDDYKSLCFFLLNGPITETQLDNDVSCGVLLNKKVPLRLIYFSSSQTNKCLFIDDKDLQNLIGLLVFQDNKALREEFKLSSVSLSATTQEFRREVVWQQIFGNQHLILKENQQLFSVDFDLIFEGNPACWIEPCAAPTPCITISGGPCLTNNLLQTINALIP